MADNWRVINQRQTSTLTAAGSFTDVMEVSVETVTGTVIQVMIPLSQYSAEYARTEIERRVADVLEVETL